MKTVRLDSETEKALKQAAGVSGVNESEFIRQAIRSHAGFVLDESLEGRLSDVLGTIRTKGGRARQSGNTFTQILKKEPSKRRS